MATPQELQTLITKLQTNMTRFDNIINGDDTTEVTTDNAVVPSIAKAIQDINNAYAANNVLSETQNNANDAEGWAITPEDVQFTDSDGTTGFSALHYAAKAATASNTTITTNDTTPDFLNNKLLVTAPIIKTINNAGGNETLTLSPAIASQAEAEAGTATDKLMTPERVAQAIAELGSSAFSIKSTGSFTAQNAVQFTGISKPTKIILTEVVNTDNRMYVRFEDSPGSGVFVSNLDSQMGTYLDSTGVSTATLGAFKSEDASFSLSNEQAILMSSAASAGFVELFFHNPTSTDRVICEYKVLSSLDSGTNSEGRAVINTASTPVQACEIYVGVGETFSANYMVLELG